MEAVRSLRKSGMKLDEVIRCCKYTVEQWEAVTSLRGIKVEEVIDCFMTQQSEELEAKHQASTSAVRVFGRLVCFFFQIRLDY